MALPVSNLAHPQPKTYGLYADLRTLADLAHCHICRSVQIRPWVHPLNADRVAPGDFSCRRAYFYNQDIAVMAQDSCYFDLKSLDPTIDRLRRAAAEYSNAKYE